ncbi:class I SAM-dependent methyltransferase [Sphingomonas adhaesiva]|uniref:class I SAM-dependent methyltransferase n=1 Tax=Sphingomonas adhaesiva TaxID=28212 RepID=UPI002FFBC3AD
MAQPTATAAADDYQRLAAEQAIVVERLAADIGIPAGARVLDIACGTGHAALAAARRNAEVVGIDIDEPSIARARFRAEAEGLSGIDFQVGDARTLPYPDASFDVVLSTLGLVFFPDQEAAAKELARVTRPGGKIALTAYTTRSIPAQMFDLGHELQGAPIPAHPHYAWSNGPRAAALLQPYFHDVRVRHDRFETCFASAAAWTDHVAQWNPNMRKMLATRPAEFAAQWRARAQAIMEPHNRATDGTFLADMDYAIVTALRRP